VKIAESWFDLGEEAGRVAEDETYLTPYGTFFIKDFTQSENYYISDIKRIPAEEFLTPEKILSNLVNEMAKGQEKRKEKMDEILMAKRIVDAMSETLLNKQPTKKT
jgi:hypothetical protein